MQLYMFSIIVTVFFFLLCHCSRVRLYILEFVFFLICLMLRCHVFFLYVARLVHEFI